jgi:hypothetical protein
MRLPFFDHNTSRKRGAFFAKQSIYRLSTLAASSTHPNDGFIGFSIIWDYDTLVRA